MLFSSKKLSVFAFALASHLWWIANVEVAKVHAASPAAPSYNRDIRPILADKCFACHGADSATREAGLRLDVREDAMEAGAIAPGSVDESLMITRIMLGNDDEEVMPPKKSHKALTAEEKETLTTWIRNGAMYEQHWSFITPTRPELPSVASKVWPRNPIDHFILARLESEGLAPAAEADRRTLARRAALDVTGLPPDPKLVDEFVADDRPEAYERYLDRLFALSGWGEHRARHWLDYARYADTHGIHFDNFREIWAYRDWVINAFNQNMPFDQFSIEQLAGDMLESPTLDQQVATGFNRCNMTTNEGGIIDEEYAVLYARDRTETTSAVWLGLTTGCAVCHDHKFDPVSQKEFYSLAAFFNNTTQPVRDGNIPNTPPIVVVPEVQDRERFKQLAELLPATNNKLAQLLATAKQNVASLGITPTKIAESMPSSDQLVLHATLGEGNGETTNVLVNGKLVPVTATGPLKWADGHTQAKSLSPTSGSFLSVPEPGNFEWREPFTAAAWVYQERAVNGAIVARMDDAANFQGWDLWLNDGRISSHVIHHWPDKAVKVISKDKLPEKQWVHVAVVNDGSGTIDGIRLYVNGVEQKNREIANKTLGAETIRTDAPLTIGSRRKSSFVEGLSINDVRLYNAALTAANLRDIGKGSAAMYAASLVPGSLKEPQLDMLAQWWLDHESQEYRDASAEAKNLKREDEEIRRRGTIAHVMNEKPEPAIAFVLNRGEYDQRLDQVSADVPAALPPMQELPRNRLGLAQWLFSKDHPLTSRVTVNRFWQEVFGTGLVRTSGDFGITGELPSHPELLDWLSVEFRESGWDVQSLFRTMLTSATYRQSARTTPRGLEIDAENRLLSRGPRFRMDGEMVRDMALWSAGLMTPKIGGPSVRPYQPVGVWEAVAMPGSNTRDYQEDKGEALYRRSMYTFWKRAAPPASMEIFNAPNREVCTVRRERSNTPLQALVTLNDPQFIEASRMLASMTLATASPTDQDRLQFIAARLLSRPLTDDETKILLIAINDLKSHYASHEEETKALLTIGYAEEKSPIDQSELAAWTMLASEMMNLDETLCK
jgi:mono/diheme cytochrome c family protein